MFYLHRRTIIENAHLLGIIHCFLHIFCRISLKIKTLARFRKCHFYHTLCLFCNNVPRFYYQLVKPVLPSLHPLGIVLLCGADGCVTQQLTDFLHWHALL
jgi:hypothetical protein